MAQNAPSRPGLKQGRTHEFTLFFNVKPGQGQQIREVFQQPGFEKRREEMNTRIGTLHDARWVLFDDDTRLMFATNFDGDWDAYIDDFSATPTSRITSSPTKSRPAPTCAPSRRPR
ncbi:hypothetical protein [Streptomyces hesseae]|uniref:Uncharacterized protein n=1 Tax=Streptomyces hesseae TaxID=3075519 RepID=A0ABU2SV45_9ACTN|nr:hypothetical protein [Streptomyces sp. DSM 40473]MDT0452811.1 hypothetical protein [Streptomyces sp. DSM 40473]